MIIIFNSGGGGCDFPRWNSATERDKSNVFNLHNGENGKHMGQGLQGIQARKVAKR